MTIFIASNSYVCTYMYNTYYINVKVESNLEGFYLVFIVYLHVPSTIWYIRESGRTPYVRRNEQAVP